MSSTVWYTHVSLLRGLAPYTVDVVAFTTFACGVAWWRRPPWHWVAIAGMAGVAAFAVAHVIDIPARFGNTYPPSFIVWGALPLFAVGAAAWQWPKVGWARRCVALLAIPALATFAALQINLHYGHIPTIGDLLHAPLPGQVSPTRLLIPSGSREPAGVGDASLPSGGLVAHLDIPAPESRFVHRRGWVWVPPAYFSVPHPRLPVLMLLTGTPGSPDDWFRAGGALTLADQWAAAHNGVAPVMVLPDANGSGTGDTECVDGPRGHAETYLTVDVPRFMIEHFGVAAHPRQWAVVGLSEGGTCALTLVARHPGRFSTFADFAGYAAPTLGNTERTIRSLYNGSTAEWRAHDPVSWFAKDASAGVEGFFVVGSDDHGDIQVVTSLAANARAAHLKTVVDVLPGGAHNWYAWRRALRDAYPWLVTRLGTAETGTTSEPSGR
ncbi:MAG: alpha/beta hydrolase-fold protein [Actinomycetota bacterium]|nr:alpha/beta hydrolase-fold protein [Actinomycetota bacterium]